jgi:lipid A oxidase
MIGSLLRKLSRVHLVLVALIMTILFTQFIPKRLGDRLQVALPTIAFACSVFNGTGSEFAARFFGMLVVVHGTKAALGDAEINQRPAGGLKGFPSGHTAAAAMGASALVHDCIAAHPVGKAMVVLAAAFVGGSRIDTGKHDVWQVLAGGLLGWGADRALRGNSAARRRVIQLGDLVRQGSYLVLARGLRLLRRRALSAAVHVAALLAALSARAEVEISAYGGFQTAPHSTIEHSVLGPDFVKWEGRSFDTPPYWGLRATWWRNERLGYGVEFNHAKVYADNPSAYGYDVLELTDGINFLTANVWRRWQNEGKLTPYAGAGLGVAIPYVEVQPAGESLTRGYQLTGPVLHLIGGAAWEIDPRWSLFAEYKFTWSSHEMDLDSGGTLKTDIITNALNIGVSFRF